MSHRDLDRASDPNTTPGELAELARHSDPKIRERVAHNPATPHDVLSELATFEEDEYVLQAIVLNPATDEETRHHVFYEAMANHSLYMSGFEWSPELSGITEEEWSFAEAMSTSFGMDPDGLVSITMAFISPLPPTPEDRARAVQTRRDEFFGLLVADPTAFEGVSWRPSFEGISELEWGIAQALAPLHHADVFDYKSSLEAHEALESVTQAVCAAQRSKPATSAEIISSLGVGR